MFGEKIENWSQAIASSTQPQKLGGIYMRPGRTQTGMNLYRYDIFSSVYMKQGRNALVPGLRKK